MKTGLYKLFIVISSMIITSSGIDIRTFQPSIIPIDSVTKLVIATADQLNTSSSIQCRFNDISMPARLSNNLVFCETPPMRKTDKVALHLEVDGKLYKAKTPLRFHESFKVTGIKPNTAFPSQQLSISISGITCEDWMTFFVRFQTVNGTKQTRKGICVNSTATCYVPVFPAQSLLRVGVTLSNRFVEWSTTKLLVQYPVDSMKSSVKDLIPDVHRQGAFTFKVVPRDKFMNSLTVDSDQPNSVISGFSVQYAPYDHPRKFQFLSCNVSVVTEKKGSIVAVSCGGAEHERILVYPLINNVAVGNKTYYEVTTTLCPGKTRCTSAPTSDDKITTIIIMVTCTLVVVVAAIILVVWCERRRSAYGEYALANVDDTEDIEMHEQSMGKANVKASPSQSSSAEHLPSGNVNEEESDEEETTKEAEEDEEDEEQVEHSSNKLN